MLLYFLIKQSHKDKFRDENTTKLCAIRLKRDNEYRKH